MRPKRVHVYAVIRFDLYSADPELAVTVKEVVPSQLEAEAEVARLKELAKDRGDVRYFWQVTRYFPEGRRLAAY